MPTRPKWLNAFRRGEFVICRLTPDKYHYNHTPVAGVVRDFYQSDGTYHSCNPGALLSLATPYSKNKRVITVIDTDVTGGTGVGLVAMIEVVALMIGDIAQRYSDEEYHNPRGIGPGCFSSAAIPRVYFVPAAARPFCCFKKTASNSPATCCAISAAPASKAVTPSASANRFSKPTSRFAPP